MRAWVKVRQANPDVQHSVKH